MEPSNIAMDFQSPVRGQNADIDEFVTPWDSQNDFGDPSAPSIAVSLALLTSTVVLGVNCMTNFMVKRKEM